MNNNSEDSNTERPLPPLPSNDGPLDPLDESPDDSSDIDENDSDECSSDEADDDQITNEPSTKLLNGTSSNGSNEYDDNFDPDATLPPSPSKTTITSLTEFTSANSSSHEMPSSPENERFNTLHIFYQQIHSNELFRFHVCAEMKFNSTNDTRFFFSFHFYFRFVGNVITHNNSGLSSNAELRRRKRQKRQSDMEAKIKDIKRKQKESEAAAEAAPKKRRCLMIFSGVVVCVICCAYVYSKLG